VSLESEASLSIDEALL